MGEGVNGPNRPFDGRSPLRPPGPRWYKGGAYDPYSHLLSGIPPHVLEGRRFDATAACGYPIAVGTDEAESPNVCPKCWAILRGSP